MKHRAILIGMFALLPIIGALTGITRSQADTAVSLAAVRYVAPHGTDGGGNTCTNSANPCQTIVHAMSVSADGDTINLAAGTYNETLGFFKSLTLTGASSASTVVDGGGNDRVATVYGGSAVQISGVTLRNGHPPGASDGGGIANWETLTLDDVVVSGNTSHWGGGIDNAGILTMTNSTVSGNTADMAGGLLNSGTATIQNSTFSGNIASGTSGGLDNSSGATMSLTNVTISGNSSSGAAGIDNGGTLTLLNCTIADNEPNDKSAGVSNYGTITAKNTLIAANGDGVQCYGTGTFTSSGHNMESGDSCGFDHATDLPNSLPRLRPLADNGGSTQTHNLWGDSPAIDAGDNSGCPATDQRGSPRPVDGDQDSTATCDIGAFEFDPAKDKTMKVFLPLVVK